MEIVTRTAVIPLDSIQAAYNDAVMSGRMALAREIAQLWLSALAEQKFRLVPIGINSRRSKKERLRFTVISDSKAPRTPQDAEGLTLHSVPRSDCPAG